MRDYGFKTVGDCVRMMELYASCRLVRTPLRRLCLGVLEKLPLLRDRFFAGLLTVGGPALGYYNITTTTASPCW